MSNIQSEQFNESKLEAEQEPRVVRCSECHESFVQGYDTGMEDVCRDCAEIIDDNEKAIANRKE